MNKSDKHLIETYDVAKDYGSAQALKGINFVVSQGEWVNIMGPSGSGKSTLLNLLGGLDQPTCGKIMVEGVELNRLTEEQLAGFRREKVGFIFQQFYLIPYLTALENVMLAQYLHSIPDEEEASELLKKVGLSHRLKHRPGELSGGEQQRVCIARALINNPQLLLADEPTGNLDRENTRMIMELLNYFHTAENITIILVTHNPFVTQWGTRIITLDDGRIIKDQSRVTKYLCPEH